MIFHSYVEFPEGRDLSLNSTSSEWQFGKSWMDIFGVVPPIPSTHYPDRRGVLTATVLHILQSILGLSRSFICEAREPNLSHLHGFWTQRSSPIKLQPFYVLFFSPNSQPPKKHGPRLLSGWETLFVAPNGSPLNREDLLGRWMLLVP